MTKISKRKAAIVATVSIVVTLVALFAAGETATRLHQHAKYGIDHDVSEMFTTDSNGWRVMRPNLNTLRVHTDSRGFRNPELTMPKPPGIIRIAFLGASTTFCAEVSSDEATWPHLVVRQLQSAMPDAKFDYVNAAVPGSTIELDDVALVDRVAPVEPDVVIFYEASNELSGDTRALAIQKGMKVDPPEESNWILRQSVLLYLVDKNIRAYTRREHVLSDETQLQYDPEPLAAGYEQRVITLAEHAKKMASIVALATFSQRVRPGQTDEGRKQAMVTTSFYMPYMSAEGIIAGFAAYNRAMARAAAQTGVLLIGDENAIPADDRNFVDSVHFTDAGSARQAERVAVALLRYEPLRTLAKSRAHAAAQGAQ